MARLDAGGIVAGVVNVVPGRDHSYCVAIVRAEHRRRNRALVAAPDDAGTFEAWSRWHQYLSIDPLDIGGTEVHNEPMSKLILIRAALTDAEWKRIRQLAIKQDTTTAKLVAQGLREFLLKGAKP